MLSTAIVKANSYPVTIEDDLGRKVTINQQPNRIISLAPSHTENLFALGLGSKVIGVTEYADYPQATAKIKKIGVPKESNLEQIIKLQPDLVLAAGITPKRMVSRLEQLGIKVIGLNPQTIPEIVEAISLIGKATGQIKQANELTTKLNKKIKTITNVVKENLSANERPKVFYEVWRDPLYTAGPNTFVNDLINLAGGINIARNAQGTWPQYNFEVLLAKNPDVYLASKHSWKYKVTKQSIKERENFKEIKAIKEGRISILDPNIVNRPTPRLIIVGLEKVAKAIHPQLFKEE